MTNLIAKDKHFYKTMMMIALPVIIQNVISIGLNMVDTIMVSSLGEDAISAVGLANRIYFIFTTICFGIYSGASIFIAQYWGAEDRKNIKKVFGIDLSVGLLLALLFSIVVLLAREKIMSTFIDDPVVVGLGAKYLRIVVFSYIFTAVSFAFSFNSRAVHKLILPTIINAVALCTNTFLNWIWITGNLGFKAMGVEGAALATLISRIIEMILLLFFIYRDKNHPLAGGIRDFTSWDMNILKNIVKTSLPVVLSETAWSVGTSVYFIAYGFLGSYAVAVVQVAYNISDFFQAVFFGIGNACAVMIGNEIGKNQINKAIDYSKIFIKITLVMSIILSVLLFIFRGNIIKFFSLESATSYYLNKTLIVFSFYFTPKMFAYLFICGIMRSGGDTKFCMFMDMIGIWGMGVPLAFISVLVFRLQVHFVVALVFSEEIMKLVVLLKRYNSRKWINSVIDYNME